MFSKFAKREDIYGVLSNEWQSLLEIRCAVLTVQGRPTEKGWFEQLIGRQTRHIVASLDWYLISNEVELRMVPHSINSDRELEVAEYRLKALTLNDDGYVYRSRCR